MASTVTVTQGVTLLGAGELAAGALTKALSHAPVLVAADGGADRALAEGRCPDRVIGDLDSISDPARANLADRLVHVPGQDDTDFDKALDRIAAPLILALGFTGGRLDHTLAAFSSVGRRPQTRIVIWGADDLAFVLPPRIELDLPPASRVSLWPLRPVGCKSEGLVWPTAGLPFDPVGLIGTSNAVARGPVRLAAEGPGMLCLLPLDALEAVLPAISSAQPWPAPAPAR